VHVFIVIGSLFGFLGVVLGAFGAHALRDKLTTERMAVFQTGVQYQMYHALALVGIGVLGIATPHPTSTLTLAGWLFTAGTVLFSGSLYALCGSGIRKLGAITPLGGVAFLLGWLLLFLTALHL